MIKTWNDKLKTNIPIIDEQHEVIINLLYGIKMSKLSKSEIYNLLSELQAFLSTHFELEEGYMADANYPELISHKADHEKAMRNYQDILECKDVDCSTSEIALKLIQYVQTWFFVHYEREDLKMAEYLKKDSI